MATRVVGGIEASLCRKLGVGNVLPTHPLTAEIDDESSDYKIVHEESVRIMAGARAQQVANRNARNKAQDLLMQQVERLTAQVAALNNGHNGASTSSDPPPPPARTFTDWNSGLYVLRNKHSDDTRGNRKDRVVEIQGYNVVADEVWGRQIGGKSEPFRMQRAVWETGLRNGSYQCIRAPGAFRIHFPSDQKQE